MDLIRRSIRGRAGGLRPVWPVIFAAGVAGAEAVKILLGRGPLRPAPHFFQFDAYKQVLARGRIPWGNRNPWQRLKRRVVASALRRMGWEG